jgi:hypothetical protein
VRDRNEADGHDRQHGHEPVYVLFEWRDAAPTVREGDVGIRESGVHQNARDENGEHERRDLGICGQCQGQAQRKHLRQVQP